jgi:4-amino-4-deoxy-L-arabinose transferase-like glycosyltransferase
MKIIAACALALWAGAAVYGLRTVSGPGVFFHLWSVLVFLFMAASAFSAGAWALGKAGFERDRKAALFIPSALTLGLGMEAIFTMLLGALGILYPAAQAVMLGVMLWLGRDNFASLTCKNFDFDFCGWDGLTAFLLAATFILCFAPPQQYDSLVYHLAMPQAYVAQHALVALPENIYSHFPQNGEMLFTSALLLGSDLAAQMISWLAALLAVWWIYAYARRFGRGGLAAFIAASHTSMLLLCAASYVETLVCMFVTGALVSLLEWRVSAEGRARLVWIALSGLFCGFALGVKYYAGITAAGLFFVGIYHCYSVQRFSIRRKLVVEMGAFVALAALPFVPWLVKNIYEIGNPVYPFLYHLFNGTGGSASNNAVAQAKVYFFMLTEYGYGGWFFRTLFHFPFTLFARPDRFGGGMDVLGIFGWDLLFAAVPLMWLAARKRPELRWIWAYVVFHFFIWFMTARVLRFFLPVVPAASLLAAEGIYALEDYCTPFARAAVWIGLAFFTCGRLYTWAYANSVQRCWDYVLGAKSRAVHLQGLLPYYPCAAAYNAAAAPGARVLLAGEQRSYYVSGNVTATSLVHVNGFVNAADGAVSPEDLRQKLAHDYDWLIYTPKEEQRLRFYGTLNFSGPGYKNWSGMISVLQPAYKGDLCTLYKLR